MKTLFNLNWMSASRHWMGGFNSMGQEYVEPMTPEAREAMLATIKDALDKVPAIDDLVAYSGDYDPNLSRTLGMDSTRFWALSNSVAPLYQTVKDVMDRLYESEPQYWTLNAAESAAVKQWTTGISEMYKIYVNHKDKPLQLPVNVKAPPGFTNTYEYGSTPPPGATVTPGTKIPGTTPQQKQPTAQASDILTTKNLLIGGGIAVGVGLLIYAVTSL